MGKFAVRAVVALGAMVAVSLGSMTSAFATDATAPPSGVPQPSGAPTPVTIVAVSAPATTVALPAPAPAEPSSTSSVLALQATAAGAGTVSEPIVVDPKLDPPQPPPAGTSATGRVGSSFAATPNGTEAVLYGGGDVFGGGTALADTWVWNGTTWTPKCGTTTAGATAPCAPGARDLAGAGTGPNGVVLYGGQTGDGSGNQTGHDDSYLWNGTTWQTVCTHCPPGTRAAPAMAGNGVIVLLFGGGDTGNNSPGQAFGDTWELTGATWTQVNPGGAGQPVGRLGGSMAWDGHHFVLFGGLVPGNNQTTLADTWIWTGATWVQACGDPLAACGPAPRVLGGFANLAGPEPSDQGALLVGGLGFEGNNQPPNVLGDIWYWNSTTWTQESSPWPTSTPLDNGFPDGLPLVGALAALPATCQVTLTADFASEAGRAQTASPGTWNIGFDSNGDGAPGPCLVPSHPSPAGAVHAALTAAVTGGMPRTGADIERDAIVGALLLAAGILLTLTARRHAWAR